MGVKDRPGPRWCVRWASASKTGESKCETLDAALDEVVELVGSPTVTAVEVFLDQPSNMRVRWEKGSGFLHATPYAQQYLAEHTA